MPIRLGDLLEGSSFILAIRILEKKLIKGVGDKRELFTYVIDYHLSPTPLIAIVTDPFNSTYTVSWSNQTIELREGSLNCISSYVVGAGSQVHQYIDQMNYNPSQQMYQNHL